ncbi:glycosyltransferase family 4 protein [Petrimonas sulfuriphila]|uniref:glycosyltransferase family 4 protein n=1 Tax=Petrimonas sulfuriphila TaxID=285070 RepID=UPI00324A51BD
MRIGIDASNIGGGGGVTHLKEILANLPELKEIEKVTVFASQKVLKQLSEVDHIKKITFPALNKGLLNRVVFQLWDYDKHLKQHCDILFSVTGDYLGRFKPVVGMSQNMLLYERNIWKEIKQPKEIMRFWLNFLKQRRCFSNASGIIFISQYAKKYVSNKLNLKNKEISIIHHGISPRFQGKVRKQFSIDNYSEKNPFKLLYVSTVHVYKHQWNLVEAVDLLRKKGYPIVLDLVGGVIFKPAGKKLEKVIQEIDPHHKFIHYHGHVPYDKIDEFYKKADGIVYASTCENMPNILIESMASGLPIVCSNKQPMPEFLKENGFYFDAKNVDSISNAIEEMFLNPEKRESMAKRNFEEVKKYSWEITANETFSFLEEIYTSYYGNRQ